MAGAAAPSLSGGQQQEEQEQVASCKGEERHSSAMAVHGTGPPLPAAAAAAAAAATTHPASTTNADAAHAHFYGFRKDFFFRRRHGRLDWDKLTRVDLDRVVAQVDIDTLQDNIEHLTFADIGEEDLRFFSDANFVQLFRLCQLEIEYLLNVQNYLLGSAGDVREIQAHNARLQKALRKKDRRIKGLAKNLKYCQRVLQAYERSIGPLGKRITGIDNQFPCPFCHGAWISQDSLDSHIQRRHPQGLLDTSATASPTTPPLPPTTNTQKATAPPLQTQEKQDAQRGAATKADIEQLKKELDQFKARNELERLRLERDRAAAVAEASHAGRLEDDASFDEEEFYARVMSRIQSEMQASKDTQRKEQERALRIELEKQRTEQERLFREQELAHKRRMDRLKRMPSFSVTTLPGLSMEARYPHDDDDLRKKMAAFKYISENMTETRLRELEDDLEKHGLQDVHKQVKADLKTILREHALAPTPPRGESVVATAAQYAAYPQQQQLQHAVSPSITTHPEGLTLSNAARRRLDTGATDSDARSSRYRDQGMSSFTSMSETLGSSGSSIGDGRQLPEYTPSTYSETTRSGAIRRAVRSVDLPPPLSAEAARAENALSSSSAYGAPPRNYDTTAGSLSTAYMEE